MGIKAATIESTLKRKFNGVYTLAIEGFNGDIAVQYDTDIDEATADRLRAYLSEFMGRWYPKTEYTVTRIPF